MLHQVGDLFELNVKPRCQKVKLAFETFFNIDGQNGWGVSF
jgi:hypothetical protein